MSACVSSGATARLSFGAMSTARRVALFVALSSFAGAWGTGCGDDGPGGGGDDAPDGGVTPDGPWEEVGPYDRPDEFPRDGCVPGGFAGDAAEGIYHLQLTFGEGFTATAAVRVDAPGAAWGGVIGGRDATEARVSADDVILRFATSDGDLRAVDLCARDAAGQVTGHYARCTRDGDCFTAAVTGVEVEPLAEPAASGLTLLGEFGPWPAYEQGITVNVRVADDVAYLARYQDGLRIVSVADPANIVELGHVPVEYPDYGEIWNDVKLVDGPGDRRYALMASDVAGVVVVDVTVPVTASIVAHLGTPPEPGATTNVHTLFVDGGKAYLANPELGLEIWSLADPAAPVKLGAFAHPEAQFFSYLHDLYVEGDRAYLNYWDLGMAIVDVSDPADVRLIGSFEDYGETTSHSSWVTQIGEARIAVHGDEQWGAHVHIVDVTEGGAAFGNALAEWETRPAVSVHNVMASGNLAFMAYYQDGVRVLDLSDPAAPRPIAHFQTWPGHDPAYGYAFFEGAVGIDLDIGQGLVYVADSHRGLLVLALED